MLNHLIINNYALIERLDIDLHPGFSVITGETGAGKSIILGALGLLLGQRADKDAVRTGTPKCVVEATFDLRNYGMDTFFEENDIEFDSEDGECIVRREVTSAGKSRAFINDTPVSLAILKILGGRLIDIHSQHQNLLLQQDDFQLSTIDLLSDKIKTLMKTYLDEYVSLQKKKQELKHLQSERDSLLQKRDYLEFQYSEIETANLKDPNEQDELEQRSMALTHAEDIKARFVEAAEHLSESQHPAVEALRQAANALRQVVDVYPQAEELAERLETSFIEVKDIASDVDRLVGNVEISPDELQKIDERLDLLNSLEQKYHVASLEELISLRDQLKSQLEMTTNSDERIEELSAEIVEKEKACLTKSKEIHAIRKEVSKKVLVPSITEYLHKLGLPHANFSVTIDTIELTATGSDKVTFLFSANPGNPPRPLSEIASGGEIARVMLSLKALISSAVSLPTIIFDEIDTGVSGAVAEQMAMIMKQMGEDGRQVLSITHLPQIAAKGAYHFHVSKVQSDIDTTSNMIELTKEERINEIAHMLSGAKISAAALDNAKSLLDD